MKKAVPTTVPTANVGQQGRTGRRIVHGAIVVVASTALLGTVFLALRGFWDEAVTTGFVAGVSMWQAWRRRVPPAVSLSRRLSDHSASDPGETE